MRLLVCTQTVDRDDPVLGFFHRWIEEFAQRLERVTVVCLREGTHTLPHNVTVVPLGTNRLARLYALWRVSIAARGEYDAVFVHMSQEFVLAGGWLWKLLGKRVYLWRNHYKGSVFTDIAAAFCKNVFCTSKFSYTSKYKKTLFMPVGVDTKTFTPPAGHVRVPRSILFFGRLTPSKNPELLLEALGLLNKEGREFNATFCGPGEPAYLAELVHKTEKLCVIPYVRYVPAVSHSEAAQLCREHEIYVNCSPQGMYDKTILEASAAGCLILASNKDMVTEVPAECVFVENNAESLAHKLTHLLTSSPAETEHIREQLKEYVARHNLISLVGKLAAVIQ